MSKVKNSGTVGNGFNGKTHTILKDIRQYANGFYYLNTFKSEGIEASCIGGTCEKLIDKFLDGESIVEDAKKLRQRINELYYSTMNDEIYEITRLADQLIESL